MRLGYVISIEDGIMQIQDPGRHILARIKHSESRLYTSLLSIDTPACLLTQGEDQTWRLHARMVHLHFGALRAMSTKQMVRGMSRCVSMLEPPIAPSLVADLPPFFTLWIFLFALEPPSPDLTDSLSLCVIIDHRGSRYQLLFFDQ